MHPPPSPLFTQATSYQSEFDASREASNKSIEQRERFRAEFVLQVFGGPDGAPIPFDGRDYTLMEDQGRLDIPARMLLAKVQLCSDPQQVTTLDDLFMGQLTKEAKADAKSRHRADIFNAQYVKVLLEQSEEELEAFPPNMPPLRAMEWLNSQHQKHNPHLRLPLGDQGDGDTGAGPHAAPRRQRLEKFMGVSQAGLLRVRSYQCADKLQGSDEPFQAYQRAVHGGGAVGGASA